METLHLTENEIKEAGRIIAEGGLVAFPTETVYGLGADAMNEDACRRIYEAKGRPSDNPLIVHIARREQLHDIAKEVPANARELARHFWPGPMTLILKKKPVIPDSVTGGLSTVAVRCPDHELARALIAEAGTPIAAPSANRSGRPSPTKAAHVEEDLEGRIDAIIDGGECRIGLESTIIDVTEDVPVVLRPGFITLEELSKIIGEVKLDPAVEKELTDAATATGEEYRAGSEIPKDTPLKPKAPGMKYRHYSPKGEFLLVSGELGNAVRYINKRAAKDIDDGKSVCIIATSDTKDRFRCGSILNLGSPEDGIKVAANLYEVLRQCDVVGADTIYARLPDSGGLYTAITNRLLKAAAHRVIEAPAPSSFGRQRKLIFVEGHGNARSAMAATVFLNTYEGDDILVLSRGLVVQFPEPLNQKTEAVLKSNGIPVEGFVSRELLDEEIEQDTMIFAMEESQRQKIISKYEHANEGNVFLLSSYVGDELEIMDPYGGTLQTYGLCFEVVRSSVQKLSDMILEGKTYEQ